jgi:radical SAM/Cys-rich protein
MTNMPIHRFKAQLLRSKSYEEYMEKLAGAFNIQAATGVMCRSLVSVGCDGKLYDCDFNQMLSMPVDGPTEPATVFEFDERWLLGRRIRFASHCFGCTAGEGSSCGGKTT